MRRKIMIGLSLLGVLAQVGGTGDSYAQAPYYQGKTLRIIQGREPGGSGDVRAKLVASYLKKYLPGNPNVISEYMAGGWGSQGSQLSIWLGAPGWPDHRTCQ